MPQFVGGTPLTLEEKLASESCPTLRAKRLPVTLVTGFLGSGKTTLINHLLREQQEKRLAVVENEVGEVAIDDALLSGVERTAETEVVLLPSGCVCCKVRGDLVEALLRITAIEGLDGVILELSGLADVAPVAQTFFSAPEIQARLQLDAVVCVCDASRLKTLLLDNPPDSAEELGVVLAQISLSDRLILNKTDLIREDELRMVKQELAALNPTAVLLEAQRAVVDPSQIVGVGGFSLEKALEADRDFKELIAPSKPTYGQDWATAAGASHPHTALGWSNVGFEYDASPLDWLRFKDWLEAALLEHSDRLCRFKGVLWVDSGPYGTERRLVLQGLFGHVETHDGGAWGDAPKRSRLIFIGRVKGIEETLREGPKGCAKPVTRPTATAPLAMAGAGKKKQFYTSSGS